MDNNQNNFEQENFEQNFTEPVVPLEPEVKKPLLAVKDSLFLTMCVLLSISVAFSFNLINLLLVIGMWISFASAKSESSILSGAKFCAGTLKANYIIWWVLIGIFYFVGALIVLLTLVAPLTFTNIYFIDSFLEMEGVSEAFESFALAEIAYEVFIVTMLLVVGIFLIVMATILVFINIFFNKNVYKLAYSIRDNLTSDAPIVKAKTVSVWLIILSVFQGIGALDSLLDFKSLVVSGTTLATYIIAYIWIKKYFVEQ